MNELIEIYNMLTKLISSRNTRKSSEFKLYVDDIFEKTEMHIPDNQRSRPDWTARDSV